MQTIEPFIELGWHTVPLKGKLERLKDGTKTVPIFQKAWRKTYSENFNNKAAELGGAITGECSGIIAIDCDNENTYNLFKALDPTYEFIFKSKGKGYEAGTFIYKYTPELESCFSERDSDLSLDFYSNEGFVYLPTEANKTKVTLQDLPELKEVPNTVKTLLQQLKKKSTKTETEEYLKPQNGSHLAPLLKQFTGGKGEFIPSLFKILTPKDFRQEEQYVKYNYLHPDKVPDGRGSEYLSKVSAILGADESVNEELYMDCMIYINKLFSEPLDDDRLDRTICTPMLEGTSRIGNEPIWRFNKQWNDQRFALTAKHGVVLDLGFDKDRNTYYVLDLVNEKLTGFHKDTEFMSYLDAIIYDPPKKKELKQKLPIVKVDTDPSKDFGFCPSNEPQILGFNNFKSTAELSILNKPEDYKEYYKKPATILKYLETLVPDENNRNYLLGFIKRKLLTFEYSPVVLYFLGVPGSGKDTLVEMLSNIIDGVAKPTAKEFIEVYNSWVLDSYFVHLDEYGNQLNRMQDKAEALGKIKAYSGKKTITVRKMRVDGFSYDHKMTFIMTANSNPLMLEDGDRRIMLFETPNKLEDQSWFNPDMWDKMMAEIKDFCYYLATEVKMLPRSLYLTPPDTEEKHKLIADSMFAAQKICYAFKHKMWNYVKELAKDHNVDSIVRDLTKGYVMDNHLEDLYDELTDYRGDMKSLRKILRREGFNPQPTTKDGKKTYLYRLEEFNDNPFTPDED